MSISTHFPNITLTADQQIAVEKLNTFLESEDNVFMLKGYAGTGKTTLIKGLVSYLEDQNREFQVMAPTGRAAKILRQKTKHGLTIHKSIYKFDDVDFSKDSSGKLESESYKIIYPIIDLQEENIVLIIDEASMITSRLSEHPIFIFGTDILLNDLLTYAKPHNLKTKIIFVGDPAQLPPVGDNKSMAFERSYFENLGLSVVETELKEVKRQGDNLILKNASLLRDKIQEVNPRELFFSYDDSSFIRLNIEDIVNRYVDENPIPEIHSGVIISFSNAQCFHNNKAVRKRYFPYNENITSGDVIQIISNNYRSYPTEVFNGDFAKIMKASEDTISQTAPVFVEENGKKIKKEITLVFRKVELLVDHHDAPFECLIIDSLLNSQNRDLTIDEMKALYINFIIRFDEDQKSRIANGLLAIKRYSKEFKEMMILDPFMNAMRCKYGYAITCHKAQGGEWEKVFVDYSGRVSLHKDPLRWCYTATTRGIETCFAINAPHFNRFSKFRISEIAQIGVIPKTAFRFENVPLSPFHRENQHLCKSKKYWDVVEALEETNFEIKNIFSQDYMERYYIANGDQTIVIDGYHNGAGVFEKGFYATSGCDDETKYKIEELFNRPMKFNYNLNYNPSLTILEELYSIMQHICGELEVPITNVEEFVMHNYVNYYLQTDSVSSYIQFYFNKDQHLTVAMPKTYKCSEDKKLALILTKLLENVI